MNTVLAVDIGTTSLKAGFISADGEVVSFCRQRIPFFTGRFVAGRWLKILKKSVKKMYKLCGREGVDVCVEAIAVSGNGPTIVSKSGKTLRWNEKVDYNRLGISGHQYEASLFLPRIMAFKECFPSDYASSDFLFSGPEYLIYKLCNSAVTILPEKRFESAYWDKNGLAACGIDGKKLPDFVGVGQSCGKLQKSVAEYLGLPDDIPVISGGPDFVVALIGTNTLSTGKICDRSGSSEGFNFCVDRLILSEGVRSLPSVIPGLWNVSVLIPESGKLEENARLEKCKKAVTLLQKVAFDNGIYFSGKITATGGQAKSEEFMAKKSLAIGLSVSVCQISDAELLGDACAAWFALGKYSSLQEAANSIVKETVTYGNL